MRKSRFGILVVSGLVLGLVSGSLALDPLETQVLQQLHNTSHNISGLVLGLVSGSQALDPLETQVRIDHLEKRIDLLEKINIEKIIENEKLEKRLASVERYINLLKPQIIRQGLVKKCSSLPEKPEHVWEFHAGIRQDPDAEGGYSASVSLTCAPGYFGEGGTAECLIDGTWSKEFKCEEALVVITGGLAMDGTDGPTKAVEVVDFTSKCQVTIPEMTIARAHHNLLYTGGELLACNGFGNSATCESWRPGQSSWKNHSRLPLDANEGLFGAGEYVSPPDGPVQGSAYIIGGSRQNLGTVGQLDVEESSTIYSLDSASHQWRKYGELKASRVGFCLADVSPVDILLIGGASDSKPTANIVHYVLSQRREGTDVSIPSLPEPVSQAGCGYLSDNGHLLVAGGAKSDKESPFIPMNDVYLYEMYDGQKRSTGASLNHARAGHKLVLSGESLYALGGIGINRQDVSRSIEKYNNVTREWELLDQQLARGRAQFAATHIPRSWFPECQ